MHIDFTEILVETVRQVLKIEGKDPDNDEYVELVLNKLFSDPDYADCVARCITMKDSFTNFKTYQMMKR